MKDIEQQTTFPGSSNTSKTSIKLKEVYNARQKVLRRIKKDYSNLEVPCDAPLHSLRIPLHAVSL